jgi:hypothetical protein
MAHGIGLVFPEKRKAHVYRKISAWHDYSFTTFHYCLSRLNALFLPAILVKEKTSFFCYSALLAQHTTFGLPCGAPGYALHTARYPKYSEAKPLIFLP